MRKALTMSLAIIIEASLFVLADLITRTFSRFMIYYLHQLENG